MNYWIIFELFDFEHWRNMKNTDYSHEYVDCFNEYKVMGLEICSPYLYIFIWVFENFLGDMFLYILITNVHGFLKNH